MLCTPLTVVHHISKHLQTCKYIIMLVSDESVAMKNFIDGLSLQFVLEITWNGPLFPVHNVNANVIPVPSGLACPQCRTSSRQKEESKKLEGLVRRNLHWNRCLACDKSVVPVFLGYQRATAVKNHWLAHVVGWDARSLSGGIEKGGMLFFVVREKSAREVASSLQQAVKVEKHAFWKLSAVDDAQWILTNFMFERLTSSFSTKSTKMKVRNVMNLKTFFGFFVDELALFHVLRCSRFSQVGAQGCKSGTASSVSYHPC